MKVSYDQLYEAVKNQPSEVNPRVLELLKRLGLEDEPITNNSIGVMVTGEEENTLVPVAIVARADFTSFNVVCSCGFTSTKSYWDWNTGTEIIEDIFQVVLCVHQPRLTSIRADDDIRTMRRKAFLAAEDGETDTVMLYLAEMLRLILRDMPRDKGW